MAYQTVPVMMTLSDLQGIAKLAFSNAISYTVVQQMTGTGVLLCSRSTIAKPFVYRRDVFPVQWKPSTHLRKFKTLATFVHHRTPEETGTAPYMLALRSTGFLMFSLYFVLILLANVKCSKPHKPQAPYPLQFHCLVLLHEKLDQQSFAWHLSIIFIPLLFHHSAHPLFPLFHFRLKTYVFHKSYPT